MMMGLIMWIKCKDRLPPKDGIYMTAEKYGEHIVYRIVPYVRDLGRGRYMPGYEGKSGFYDSDPEYGSFVIKPEAWKYIEKYRG